MINYNIDSDDYDINLLKNYQEYEKFLWKKFNYFAMKYYKIKKIFIFFHFYLFLDYISHNIL